MLDSSEIGVATRKDDDELINRLEMAIYNCAKGADRFRQEVPRLLRQAIDEVIDTARSNRFTIDEIEKTEKTYIGTKIEILLRNFLGVPRGEVLDFSIDGIEVDVKNTIGRNWAIPKEAVGHPCLLIKEDELRAICAFGIVVIREEILSRASNRDGKRTLARVGLDQIRWLLIDHPYPQNFWQSLPPETLSEVKKPKGGAERLAVLFRRVQRRPISRLAVSALAQQSDPMKRIRRNGGARDHLASEGIAILWGSKDRHFIEKLGLPNCGPDEFISCKPETEGGKAMLRAAGHID